MITEKPIEAVSKIPVYQTMMNLSGILIPMLSIAVGFVILLDHNRPDYYEFLPLLPLGFSCVSFLFFFLMKECSCRLTCFLVITLYSIRNMVTPLIMRYGGYYGAFTMLNRSDVNRAIALMLYETLVVFFFLSVFTAKANKRPEISARRKNPTKRQIHLFGLLLAAMIIFCIFSYLIVPEIILHYKTIFDTGGILANFGTNEAYLAGSYKRILFTCFTVGFAFLQIFVSVWLIYLIHRRMGDTAICILASIGIILLQFLFLSGSDGYTMIVIAVLCMLILKLFHKRRKLVIVLLTAVFATGCMAIFLMKIRLVLPAAGMSEAGNLSYMLQAYFPGVCNMAGVFNISNPEKTMTLFFDFYETIPFRNSLFGLHGDRLAVIYTRQNMAMSQILPCVGQAYHYLGSILAPTVPCAFVYAAARSERMIQSENNIWIYISYLLLCIFASLVPVMYNFTIFGARFWATILPMLILSRLSGNAFVFEDNKGKDIGFERQI